MKSSWRRTRPVVEEMIKDGGRRMIQEVCCILVFDSSSLTSVFHRRGDDEDIELLQVTMKIDWRSVEFLLNGDFV